MKKEQRIQAEKMFLGACGKITNGEIAQLVRVNRQTVGRWKRDDNWKSKLPAGEHAAPRKAAVVLRKKATHDKAFKLFMELGGNVTNKELAKMVGVSPPTIGNWKEADGWSDEIIFSEAKTGAELDEEAELDIGELAPPEQIIQINQRIDSLLKRDYLTANEIADLAEAKSALLKAVGILSGHCSPCWGNEIRGLIELRCLFAPTTLDHNFPRNRSSRRGELLNTGPHIHPTTTTLRWKITKGNATAIGKAPTTIRSVSFVEEQAGTLRRGTPCPSSIGTASGTVNRFCQTLPRTRLIGRTKLSLITISLMITMRK